MNSEIILVKDMKLDKDYVNVLSYNESQMLELCRENAIATRDDYSFIRINNNSIYVNFTYSQCLQANYIAFQNKDYSNKWFFAFIDDVEYRNDGNTEIFYTVDAWSTWFDNWTKKPCFINRQHVNDDTVGLHTVSENLEVGDVIEESFEELFTYGEDGNDYYLAIESTYSPFGNEDFVGVDKFNGNFVGAFVFLFEAYSGSIGLPNIRNFLDLVNSRGKIESIRYMFILPKFLVNAIGTTEKEHSAPTGSFRCELLKSSDEVVSLAYPITKTLTFSSYQPKNNKCFVYPYNYLIITNNIGNYNILKYENFEYEDFLLELEMAYSIGGSGRLVPRGYKNIDYNYDESIPLAKFPTCSWASDAFINWLTQNSVNIATQVAQVGASVVSGSFTSTASSIAGLIGQFHQASLLPSISGGNNNGDVNFSARKNNFFAHHLRVKDENLKIIDDYFSRFGYAMKRVLLPNITGRRNWNYVEIGSSEEIGYGSVPSKYMQQINNACRKGVTIWHNHSNLGNFSLDNSII